MSLTRAFSRSASSLATCALLTSVLALGACAGKEKGVTGELPEGGLNLDAGADSGSFVPVCPPENEWCNPVEPAGDAGSSCGSEAVNLAPVGVNVMLAVDGSFAMKSHWDIVQVAIKKMVESNSQLNFGAHLFWANTVTFENLDKVNVCGTTENRVLDVAPDQQRSVLPWLGPRPPGPGGRWFSLRPVVDPLLYYLEHDTQLSNPTTTNYLVFISNGSDNCFGTGFAGKEDKNITYEKLASELVKKNIRVLPIGFDGETAQRTWNGMLKTNFEALDRLALHGGTGLTEALAADSAEQLEEAIGKVAQQVRSCRFKIPDTLDPSKNLNPFELTFLVNGREVPRDRTRDKGWDFLDGNTSEVELFGDVCVAVQAGATVEARKGCNQEAVCGTAASKVKAKARAVEFLVDRSFSMAACEDLGGCIFGGELSWWGKAARSITQSVSATINDDVEFGLQQFPGSKVDGCEVNDTPEVPITSSSEISIIGSMLANLPTPISLTPLVGGLEQVASNPGRLADADVLGAVIVISDGGNSCDNLTPEEAAMRLGTAAASLHEKGVKTYAIRFGNKDNNFAPQDAQLRSIVANGGTATGDPADPANTPYLEAPNEAELNAVLAALSEKLASCEFVLGETPAGANKDTVNLYINGEVIPFDSMKAKANGWGWADEARTTIEMYGDSCKQFKSNRSTSTVVEFGCVQVTVPLI